MTTLDDIREAQYTAYQNHMAAYPDFHGDREDTDAYRRLFAQAMGIEVEDPKPEPGVYLTKHGDILLVSPERVGNFPDTLVLTGSNGSGRARGVNAHQPAATWRPLTPARVVPAEPVELTEEQVGELFDEKAKMFGFLVGRWDDKLAEFRATMRETVNAALANYGHGAS